MTPGIDLDKMKMKRPKVIVVDNPDTIAKHKTILLEVGFDVMSAADVNEAIKKFNRFGADLVVMDPFLENNYGWELLVDFKQKIGEIPIVVTSTKAEKDDIVSGFNHGADDYLGKPIYGPELVARIKTILNRLNRATGDVLGTFSPDRFEFPKIGVSLDRVNRRLIARKIPIPLTEKEYEFVEVLASRAPETVLYDELCVVFDGVKEKRKRVDYQVYMLRQKLEAVDPSLELIVSVGRHGYRFNTGEG